MGCDDTGRRLDRVLRKALPELPISAIHRLLRKRLVFADGVAIGADARLKDGSVIVIKGIETHEKPEGCSAEHTAKSGKTKISDIPPVLFEGNGIIVFNKPPGIVCHGKNSLETQVLACLEGKLPPSLSFKPGPLHRLDKNTGGIVTFSTNIDGARNFSEMLRGGLLKKTYLAILDGCLENECTWQDELVRDYSIKKTFVTKDDIKAKIAVTRVKPLAVSANNTLIAAEIETGRTHQIRSSAAFHGHPLSGDKKYGGRPPAPFFLHAITLEFPDKNSFGIKKITAPPPDSFYKKIESLFGNVKL